MFLFNNNISFWFMNQWKQYGFPFIPPPAGFHWRHDDFIPVSSLCLICTCSCCHLSAARFVFLKTAAQRWWQVHIPYSRTQSVWRWLNISVRTYRYYSGHRYSWQSYLGWNQGAKKPLSLCSGLTSNIYIKGFQIPIQPVCEPNINSTQSFYGSLVISYLLAVQVLRATKTVSLSIF